jgi:hypothetical protein
MSYAVWSPSSAEVRSRTETAGWINSPEMLLFARRFTMFQVMHEDLARAHQEQRLHAERSRGIRRGALRIAQQARASRRQSHAR